MSLYLGLDTFAPPNLQNLRGFTFRLHTFTSTPTHVNCHLGAFESQPHTLIQPSCTSTITGTWYEMWTCKVNTSADINLVKASSRCLPTELQLRLNQIPLVRYKLRYLCTRSYLQVHIWAYMKVKTSRSLHESMSQCHNIHMLPYFDASMYIWANTWTFEHEQSMLDVKIFIQVSHTSEHQQSFHESMLRCHNIHTWCHIFWFLHVHNIWTSTNSHESMPRCYDTHTRCHISTFMHFDAFLFTPEHIQDRLNVNKPQSIYVDTHTLRYLNFHINKPHWVDVSMLRYPYKLRYLHLHI